MKTHTPLLYVFYGAVIVLFIDSVAAIIVLLIAGCLGLALITTKRPTQREWKNPYYGID